MIRSGSCQDRALIVISMKENVFKDSPGWENEVEKDAKEVVSRLKNDPVMLGVLLSKLIEERENTNRLLKTLIQKIERIENGVTANEGKEKEEMLPEIDAGIMAFIREKERVTAEDVRLKFNYKGNNAASARLNRLYSLGIVNKAQIGKKMYFFLRNAKKQGG
ncbi:MAG: hypothetical protein NTY68_05670 [Candidatus Micrarchaeota archaeon]|nr:hypothetical protein [Candidatus Micrarchaeota archaeon]